MKEQILEDFKAKKKTYNAFKDRMINLLKDLLEGNNIIPHQIAGRTKDVGSLSKKIDKKGEKYDSLIDITDVVGLRVITYLESDVDPIAAIIEKEFTKDEENSIDKRILKNDQFGYRSLHVVVSLNDKRIKLPEYSTYKTIKCEIQIRSILQHAWAEIEHDLGYKGNDIPDNYKRSFNRVAALLEVADIEFVKLKLELTKYEQVVTELIKSNPDEVDINKASINSFIKTNPILTSAKTILEKESGFPLSSEVNYDRIISILNFLQINTIQNLSVELEKNQKEYLEFIKYYIEDRELKRKLTSNTILMYFGHYLALKTEDREFINKYVKTFADGSPTKSFIDKFIQPYNSFKNKKSNS